LEEIGKLLAKHKLIPFLGAGVSRSQLGLGVPELRARLSEHLPEAFDREAGLAEVAQAIEDRVGTERLIVLLRSMLLREQFDDATGTAHLLVMSLGCGIVYTTNQDNIFELAAAKYHKPHKVIVGIRDLAEAEPGQYLLVKFHGDLAEPESVVFTTSSYAQRMKETDNALDIRLRSDLLGKGLLFIGYSLQDENLRELLRQVRRVFGGVTPPCYMIVFDYQPEMETLASEFGVRLVKPRELIPDATGNIDAFERCLQELCNATMRSKSDGSLEELLGSEDLAGAVLIEHELAALEQVVVNAEFSCALKTFRANVDAHIIPEHLQRRVAEVFVSVAEKAANEDDIKALRAGVFNLYIEPIHALVAMAAYMAANHVRKRSSGFDPSFGIVSPCMTEAMWPLAAAHAVEMLLGGGYAITEGFRQMATHWFEEYVTSDGQAPAFAAMADVGHQFVRDQIMKVWPNASDRPPEFRIVRGSASAAFPFARRRFGELAAEIERSFPKRFPTPQTPG
jgi:hypothetical protein